MRLPVDSGSRDFHQQQHRGNTIKLGSFAFKNLGLIKMKAPQTSHSFLLFSVSVGNWVFEVYTLRYSLGNVLSNRVTIIH